MFGVRVSRKGVVTVPAEIRKRWGLSAKAALVWTEEDGKLVLRKYEE